MSRAVTDSLETQLLPRNRPTRLYHAYLISVMLLSGSILLLVPYLYDQYNKNVYEQAIATGNLVIQDFRAIFDGVVLESCKHTTCTAQALLDLQKNKNLSRWIISAKWSELLT
jgi:hypothetical protein